MYYKSILNIIFFNILQFLNLFSNLSDNTNKFFLWNKNLNVIENEVKQNKKNYITISAVGDLMLGTNYPDSSTLPLNPNSLLIPANSLLKKADITFGNLEGVFLNKGGKPKGFGSNIYCFRQPEDYAKILKENGFNFLSIANNHINDFGITGIETTEKTLDKNLLKYAGNQKNPFTILEKKGIKIGLIAFAPHNGCLDLNDIPTLISLVEKNKKYCNILIVSFHAGAEGVNACHITRQQEIFYDQDRGNVYEAAHAAIDAGADVIIGHGPHVPRALELYKNKIIAYSLGNFCTYAKFNLKGINSYAPLLYIKINEKGDFIEGKINSFVQLGEGGPLIDKTNAAAKLIKQLSIEDFPESPIEINDQGDVKIVNKIKQN